MAFNIHVLKFAQRTLCSGAGAKLPGSDGDQVSTVITLLFQLPVQSDDNRALTLIPVLILELALISYKWIHSSSPFSFVCEMER